MEDAEGGGVEDDELVGDSVGEEAEGGGGDEDVVDVAEAGEGGDGLEGVEVDDVDVGGVGDVEAASGGVGGEVVPCACAGERDGSGEGVLLGVHGCGESG